MHLRKFLLLSAGIFLIANHQIGQCVETAHATDQSSFHSAVADPARYTADFRLLDESHKVRTLQDFRGKVVLLVFGFTQCPDVCPTTLATLAEALGTMNDDEKKVQIILITLDPQRDTPLLLQQYAAAFHPSFIGLSASPAETEELTRGFRIFSMKVAGEKTGSYTIDHSTEILTFDPAGRLRLIISPNTPILQIIEDIQKLL